MEPIDADFGLPDVYRQDFPVFIDIPSVSIGMYYGSLGGGLGTDRPRVGTRRRRRRRLVLRAIHQVLSSE